MVCCVWCSRDRCAARALAGSRSIRFGRVRSPSLDRGSRPCRFRLTGALPPRTIDSRDCAPLQHVRACECVNDCRTFIIQRIQNQIEFFKIFHVEFRTAIKSVCMRHDNNRHAHSNTDPKCALIPDTLLARFSRVNNERMASTATTAFDLPTCSR